MGVPPIPHYIQSLPTHSPVSRRGVWMSLSALYDCVYIECVWRTAIASSRFTGNISVTLYFFCSVSWGLDRIMPELVCPWVENRALRLVLLSG